MIPISKIRALLKFKPFMSELFFPHWILLTIMPQVTNHILYMYKETSTFMIFIRGVINCVEWIYLVKSRSIFNLCFRNSCVCGIVSYKNISKYRDQETAAQYFTASIKKYLCGKISNCDPSII